MPKTYYTQDLKTINAENVKTTVSKKYNVVSLFSGCGGMDLGFEGGFKFLGKDYAKNPFDIIFANDIFKQAAHMYEDNFGIQVDQRDIKILDMNKDMPKANVDVVLGGFPCQSFSYAGKRKGLSDPRGQLYRQMIRVLDHYQPKMFVAENVDGIRNSRKDKSGQNVDKSALDTILEDFDKHGYDVQYHVLLAADYGVPQMRRRVIIIGINRKYGTLNDEYYPSPLYNENGTDGKRKWLTAKDGIDDLWDKVNKTSIPNQTSRDISKAKFYPGKKMQGNNKISANRPSPTIRAEHHGNIEAHYRTTLEDKEDMTGWRRLSVRECARLQSFPDTYNFTASASSAYKAIGNAVSSVLAWNIARSVYYTLNNLDN